MDSIHNPNSYICFITGKDLYEKYTLKRDYSGSEDDNYGQLLPTIWAAIKDDIFPLLEKAEKENKKLSVQDFELEYAPEITTDSIVLR